MPLDSFYSLWVPLLLVIVPILYVTDFFNRYILNTLYRMLKWSLIIFAQVGCSIDCVRIGYASLSLSSHTIAYMSILTTMKYYYGERKEYDIIPEQSIPERERDLCLCLISSLYKHLHHVCVELSKQTEDASISSRDKCTTSALSPKEIYAATYST